MGWLRWLWLLPCRRGWPLFHGGTRWSWDREGDGVRLRLYCDRCGGVVWQGGLVTLKPPRNAGSTAPPKGVA